MRRLVVATAILAALSACGDPDTEDRRGYTKAPLEDPGLLVRGEEATAMSAINQPIRPRPPLEIEIPGAEEAEAGEGEAAEVTLAPGVTQEQFDQGRELFTGTGGCQACHGPDAGGTQLAPSLSDADWLHIESPAVDGIAEVIRTGVPDPLEYPAPMPPMGGASLTPDQVRSLAAYIASIAQG